MQSKKSAKGSGLKAMEPPPITMGCSSRRSRDSRASRTSTPEGSLITEFHSPPMYRVGLWTPFRIRSISSVYRPMGESSGTVGPPAGRPSVHEASHPDVQNEPHPGQGRDQGGATV